MSGIHINLGGRDSQATTSKVGLGCLIAFLLPFFAGGIAALVIGISGIAKGERKAFIAIVVGAIFVCVATGLLVAAIKGHQQQQHADTRRAETPEQPWLWHPEWAAGEIRSEGGAGVWFAGFFAVFWNAISWTAAVAALREMSKTGDKKILFVLLFPAVGIFLIGWFVYSLLQHRKYGVSKFRMLSVPGVLGGTLRGAIEVPVQIDPPKGFKVRLMCVRRVTTGSGKNRSTSEHVEWEDEKTINKDLLAADRTRTGIPVFFNIPYHLPEPKDGNPAIVWRLTVEAEVPGIDFAARFSVPVFKTPESSEELVQREDPTASYQPDEGEYQWPAESPIRLTQRGDALEVFFPAARNKGALFFLLIFLAIWNGAIWFMVQHKAPLLFPIVFGFFDLLLLLGFLNLAFHSVRIEASSLGLKVHSAFLIPLGTKILPPGQILRVGIHRGMSSGEKVWYDLIGTDRDGKRHSLGGGIPGRRPAAFLARQIAERLDAQCDD